MAPSLLHLHTYFFFPFSIDKEVIARGQEDEARQQAYWITKLDQCVAAASTPARCGAIGPLGCWRRAAYVRADMDSPAYQDMVFFHPFVRRIFFDTKKNTNLPTAALCG